MLWIALALLVSWVGIGSLLLFRDSAAQGRDYHRQVGRRVYEQGQEVEVTLRLTPPAQATLAADHDVILALDHSSSMGAGPGSPLREALRAAENFVRRCPASIHVGLVAFDHEAQIVCPITGESRRCLRALGSIGAGGGTALHKALDRSLEALASGRSGVGKTIILLSDGGSNLTLARAAADRLRADASVRQVISIGVGPGVHREALIAVAGGPERYLHVSDSEGLAGLFGFLAAVVSGQMAVAGVVDEGARAPDPFRLTRTGGLYPIGVRPAETTRILWSVPLMDLDPVALTYSLRAQCPGWHPVAAGDSKATWRMPDATVRETQGPAGPRVLVLPALLTWAWPVLNPLFWMLFGRFFCRGLAVRKAPAPDLPTALPQSSLPAPLPELPARPYQAKVRPSLVLGLGEVGAWTVCRLKHRLQDRESDAMALLSLRVCHPASGPLVQVGGTRLAESERIELCLDLRGYVESLRGADELGPRSWVPWREWLLDTRPLHTIQGIAGDRRKARLALVLEPRPAEEQIRTQMERVLSQDGIVVITGAAADAECSGLLAEAAHICATHRGSASVVLTRSQDDDRDAPGLAALAAEIERMLTLRGDVIASDRHDPPCEARRLFDRIITLPPGAADPRRASEAASEMIWTLLAYPGVLERIPTTAVSEDRARCCEIALYAQALPVLHLWRWVRERTLAQAINGLWLGLDASSGALRPAPVSQDLVTAYADSFWRSPNFRRPRPLLLERVREILDGQNPVVALVDQLPVDSLYEEQVEFSRHQRSGFHSFCEEWCRSVLDQERDRRGWGLPALAAALHRIDRDLQTVLTSIDRMSVNEDFRNLTELASAMLLDLFQGMTRLRAAVGLWIGKMVGDQVEMDAVAPADGTPPLCLEIESARSQAAADVEPYGASVQSPIEQRFAEWFEVHGQNLLTALRFEVSVSPDRRFEVHLRCGERLLGVEDEVGSELRVALERYRSGVLAWPLDQVFSPQQVEHPASWFRMGLASKRVFPQVGTAVHEEDPFFAAALKVSEAPLRQALGADSQSAGAPFVWPEETNAERIAEEIRSSELREPRPFPAMVVQLMRDPLQLYGFLADLSLGALRQEGTEYLLERSGEEYPVGEAAAAPAAAQAMERFQDIARRVVILGRSLDGRTMPPSTRSWTLSIQEALEQVEAHPLVGALRETPDWVVWQDVIRGLVLEAGRSAQAGPTAAPQGRTGERFALR